MNKIKVVLIIVMLCTINGFSQDDVIANFKIEGYKKTKLSFIEKIALVEAGEQLDSVRIEQDIQRLKRLASFANVTYEVLKIDEHKYDVIYNVEENFTIIPGLDIFTATNGDFAFRAAVFEFNFLGRNQIVGGFYRRNVFDSYGAYWEAPYLFSRKFGLGVNYKKQVSEEPIFLDDIDDVDYRFDNDAFEFYFIYEHNFHNRFELGLNISTEDYEFLRGDIPGNFPTDLNANKVAVIGEYEYNNINIDYQYQEGFRSILNIRLQTGGNEFLRNSFIGTNDFEFFKKLGERGNWANRLRLSYATNDTTPFAPFSVDNQLNLRGVGNVIDRGTASIVLNTEYRHTLYEKGWFVMQSNAFIDAGTWREPGGKLADAFNPDVFRIYAGGGLRFMHKKIYNAIFRVDYGYGLTDENSGGMVIGIGQYF